MQNNFLDPDQEKCNFINMNRTAHPFIQQASLFQSLSKENQERLAEICLPKDLKKKEILFLEGQKGSAIYLCIQGAIQLHKTSPEGQEVVIKVIQPGELFAEVVLFEEEHYPVTAVALQNSKVFLIPKLQFDCLLTDANFRRDFLANIMAKMRYLTGQVQSLSTEDVETRFYQFLKSHYGDKKEIIISISKKDIAAAIGTTPETLSRLINKLKNDGKISWEGNHIVISG